MGYQTYFCIIDYMLSFCGKNPINSLDFQKRQMISESMKAVFQFFVNILTYDLLYDYDEPTIFILLCMRK